MPFVPSDFAQHTFWNENSTLKMSRRDNSFVAPKMMKMKWECPVGTIPDVLALRSIIPTATNIADYLPPGFFIGCAGICAFGFLSAGIVAGGVTGFSGCFLGSFVLGNGSDSGPISSILMSFGTS